MHVASAVAVALPHLLTDAQERFDIGSALSQVVAEGVQVAELDPDDRDRRCVHRSLAEGSELRGGLYASRNGVRYQRSTAYIDEGLDVAVQPLAFGLTAHVAGSFDSGLDGLYRTLLVGQLTTLLQVAWMCIQQ